MSASRAAYNLNELLKSQTAFSGQHLKGGAPKLPFSSSRIAQVCLGVPAHTLLWGSGLQGMVLHLCLKLLRISDLGMPVFQRSPSDEDSSQQVLGAQEQSLQGDGLFVPLPGWSCGHRWVSPSELGGSNPAAPPREHRFPGQGMVSMATLQVYQGHELTSTAQVSQVCLVFGAMGDMYELYS